MPRRSLLDGESGSNRTDLKLCPATSDDVLAKPAVSCRRLLPEETQSAYINFYVTMAPPPVFLSLSATGSGKVPILSVRLLQIVAVGAGFFFVPPMPAPRLAPLVSLPSPALYSPPSPLPAPPTQP